MSLLTVCPVIIPPRDGLLASWDLLPHVVVVNGCADIWRDAGAGTDWTMIASEPTMNRGCPASWNIGFRIAQESGISHVMILSQSLVATAGIAAVARRAAVLADDRGAISQHSFHCAVFSVDLWADVGGFDEGLPIYADIDFLRRGYLAGHLSADRRLPNIYVTARDERCAAMHAGAVPAEWYRTDLQRYIDKWHGAPGHEADRPTPMNRARQLTL